MKERIKTLLTENLDDFCEAFTALAKSKNQKDQRKFAGIYCSLIEFAYGKSKEGGIHD